MAWDLRSALLKKEEFESSRLATFEFKHRARTLRLLAQALALDETGVVVKAVTMKPEALSDWLARQHGRTIGEFAVLERQCAAEARRQLIEELGDPTPNRLL